ncbi:hypothetical protein GCM10009735_15960 [Actinomadura chokoriensis]
MAVAPGFAVLLIGRLILGIALSGYWSFAFGAGTRAVPGRDSVVSTSIALGVTLATIAGVPLASLLGDAVGWRLVFGVAAALGIVAALAVALTLPPVPPHPAAGLAMLRAALANRWLMAGVLGVVLVAFGNFAAYPYIRVAIEDIDAGATVWLLLAWGIGGLAGNLTAGRLAGRLRAVIAAAPLLLAGGLLVTATAPSLPVLAAGVVMWGLAFNMVLVATQLWVTRVEPERAESALSLQVTAFQVAITLGSASGGALLDAACKRPSCSARGWPRRPGCFSLRCASRAGDGSRQTCGATPWWDENARLKAAAEPYPTADAMYSTGREGSASNWRASRIRICRSTSAGPQPSARRNRSPRAERDRWTRRAIPSTVQGSAGRAVTAATTAVTASSGGPASPPLSSCQEVVIAAPIRLP